MKTPRMELVRKLHADYQDLNGSYYETLDSPPNATEFMRLVHVSRPVVIKGFRVPAHDNWTNEYLMQEMGDRPISVAVTPNGNADAIVLGDDRKLYFTEPYTEKMTMSDLLSHLSQISSWSSSNSQDVLYLQSQNDNLFLKSAQDKEISEFAPLQKDVPRNIQWVTEALGKFYYHWKEPDAVNIWIGDQRSVTSIHSDPYENIYTVIRGSKTFTLLPPTAGWCLKECKYPHAVYSREKPFSPLVVKPSGADVPQVRWPSIQDPSDPTNLPPDVDPLQITLSEGDTLYLPTGWWHYVQQNGVTVALNWWYDMEVRGMSWVWLSFLRGESEDVPSGNEEREGL